MKAKVKIEDVFNITGRGVVLASYILEGKINPDDNLIFKGWNGDDNQIMIYSIRSIEGFASIEPKPNIGIVIKCDVDNLDEIKIKLLNYKGQEIQILNNFELIDWHRKDVSICSIMNHMRSASRTYHHIISKGEKIVPDILRYLESEEGGMSIMLLLWDILKTSPYQPEKIGGMTAFNVSDARQAWINWGKERYNANNIEKH